jgi:hypothetical protein
MMMAELITAVATVLLVIQSAVGDGWLRDWWRGRRDGDR